MAGVPASLLKLGNNDYASSNRGLHGRLEFQGLQVSIENRSGSIRVWYDPHTGGYGITRMKVPYGYIRMTEGMDGDHLDCFVGPLADAKNAYIIKQMKAPDFTEPDEEKVMLGFQTAEEAKKMYLAHYSDPRFFGGMTTKPMEEFKKKALATKDAPRFLGKAVAHLLGRVLMPSRQERRLAKSLTTADEFSALIDGPIGLSMLTAHERDALRLMRDAGADKVYNLTEFLWGMREESEHKDVTLGDPVMTAKIVLAHLREHEDYYSRLKKLEKALPAVFLLRRSV